MGKWQETTTEEEALAHYATLTLPQLRRYQSIIQQQIPMAYKQGNIEALEDLQWADGLLIQAISKHLD